MADLLECLIQIKALEHSLDRVARFVAAAPAPARGQADALVARLVDAECNYGRFGLGRAADAGGATPTLSAFMAGRRANLRILQACTADDLGRIVQWPGRPGTTLADLVAIMLACDTDLIGELQRLAPR